MGHPEYAPYREELRKLLDQRYTHQQIADMFNVPRATISGKVRDYGWAATKERHVRTLPWKLHPEDRERHEAKMLRALGRRLSGKPLTAIDETKLNAFLKRLAQDRVVLHYERDAPEHQRWMEIPIETVPEERLDSQVPILKPEV